MKTTFNNFLTESDDDPFRSHNLRMEKGYKPKYRQGLIAVRFQDDENPHDKKYKDVDDKGEYRQNYQELFSNDKGSSSDFVKYFEDKYDIKKSDYRNGTDDYFIYFTCKPGEEKEKMEEIAKDKIVKVVDYVDTRGIESEEELEEIIYDLRELAFSETSTEETNKILNHAIERLKKLIV